MAATSPILHPEPFAGNALLLISIDHPHVAGGVQEEDDEGRSIETVMTMMMILLVRIVMTAILQAEGK